MLVHETVSLGDGESHALCPGTCGRLTRWEFLHLSCLRSINDRFELLGSVAGDGAEVLEQDVHRAQLREQLTVLSDWRGIEVVAPVGRHTGHGRPER